MTSIQTQPKIWGLHTKDGVNLIMNATYNEVNFDWWKAQHVRLKNHSCSAGAMEMNGVQWIFERSTDCVTLIYIAEALVIQQLECVGHVQKRVGTRTRVLKKKHKPVETAEKEGVESTKTKDPLSSIELAQ